ncbi:uncharacterized protein LOC131684524 [Topomyia yanbarensis]|uniref:uncharacterized protein LOC131684524 n=1 Tax=Topomyia yanbarensis TaxID=2498891 RepID=UPI00273CAF86|nr:uncharacterized protein LOC131684524 [Topomyia yanbarensis]XP_058823465.1 uncharacterized protein LOC131684524 [Topomyia yanbarensis]XP_058823466.1 uncharacterized protein LOC131684524 [Topomyia yanbarensis]XP_058823467.1 uncharacterized protein LOC131684524 [Topomyia yanbarensis]
MEIEIGKEEPTWEDETEADDSTITSQTIGPENGAIRCLFKVAQREFIGQRINIEGLQEWLIRAHSIESFRAYLWSLIQPHIKQPIRVELDNCGRAIVSWDEPNVLTMGDANRFVTFIDKKSRKSYSWRHISSHYVERWNSTNIVLCIHVYSTAISSRNIYEVARDTLLAPKRKPAVVVKPQRRLIPETADGYSFRDEVRALRETFLQMRDLMHILDNRILLLEEKCDQTLPHEPMIQMTTEESSIGNESMEMKPYGNSDPLLVRPDYEIKEETSDEEIEVLEEQYQ